MAIGKFKMNPYVKDNKVLVSKVSCTANVKESILKAVNLIGGFNKVVEKGDEFLLKPNFNTADPPPASSDPEFVKAVIELLLEHGAGKVVIGESSMFSLHTRNVLKETGMISKAEEAGAELVFFDEGKWIKISTGGNYLKKVSLPETALNAAKLVYVCCMKTHKFAKFTLSLKLAVGFMKPSERMLLHMRYLEEKIADLNLVVHPNLIIMDGRKCFINGGPACGELQEPNVILASGDRVAIDVETLKIIEGYEGASLKEDPWNYTQIRRAVELELGVKNEQEYMLISG
ncbi:MAG: DUF362 domain-containing protein [Candidatus Bathyarchaeota archaeon]|jgi:uncharacterized protein (DUF362 family)|nr:DUF362 domain-containing protein [Candidatus Bathyarchaeota archaeon A05DMB-5]MDH7558058.1 DUF362 domain-containing protein [Candidatus Bathyarchaeota archaeon]